MVTYALSSLLAKGFLFRITGILYRYLYKCIPLRNKKEWYRGRSLSSLMVRRKGFFIYMIKQINCFRRVDNELEKIQEISCNENEKKNVA